MPIVNWRYPGQPNYTGPNEGWFIFIHHDVILEYSYNIAERVQYILYNKPEYEQAIRLACLTHVKPSLIVKLEEARQIYSTTGQVFYTALEAYDTAWLKKHFPKQARSWDEINKTLLTCDI